MARFGFAEGDRIFVRGDDRAERTGVLAVESEDGPGDGVAGAIGEPAGEFDEGVGVADGGGDFKEQKAKGSEVNANAQGEYEECSEDEGRDLRRRRRA